MQGEEISCRKPAVEEGASIWQLVRASEQLDLNSAYCYLLLCRHFSDTCAVAVVEGEVVGFVTAYLPPGQPDTLFVWQIGVARTMRGKGLATRLLKELLQRDACRGVKYLEATVGPENQASRALFTALARWLNADLIEESCFDAEHFPGEDHEAENLLRIGPFQDSVTLKPEPQEQHHENI
jgi:L-2,4-diaminobutyric acid acetyltransferase